LLVSSSWLVLSVLEMQVSPYTCYCLSLLRGWCCLCWRSNSFQKLTKIRKLKYSIHKVGHILNILSSTSWRRMGEWIYRSMYSWLVGSELSPSRSGHFTSGKEPQVFTRWGAGRAPKPAWTFPNWDLSPNPQPVVPTALCWTHEGTGVQTVPTDRQSDGVDLCASNISAGWRNMLAWCWLWDMQHEWAARWHLLLLCT
jgi:hypothetical protein